MRPLRLLILLLVLAIALFVALIRPLPTRASEVTKSTGKHTRSSHRTRHQLRMRAERRRESRVVNYARKFIGVPYSWGGSSPRTGFDCSGFVRYVYQHFGFSLPHSSYGDLSHGRHVLRKYLKPGDLVFFSGASHVGLYIGGNRLIDAPHSGSVVHVSTMTSWYSSDYYTARRLLPAG